MKKAGIWVCLKEHVLISQLLCLPMNLDLFTNWGLVWVYNVIFPSVCSFFLPIWLFLAGTSIQFMNWETSIKYETSPLVSYFTLVAQFFIVINHCIYLKYGKARDIILKYNDKTVGGTGNLLKYMYIYPQMLPFTRRITQVFALLCKRDSLEQIFYWPLVMEA